MSHVRVKTEYQVQGAYGSTEKKTLYAHHNNSCDIVTFFDEDGTYLFSVEDTMDNNLMDAINRLYVPHKNSELNDNVQYMDADDRSKCGHVSELDIFDIMKRAYFLIPDGEATFAYYSTKVYYNEEGWYMYDANNIRQFLSESWLVLQKHVS